MTNKTFFKEIPSDPELLPEVENFVLDVSSELELDDELRNNLSLSVAEAVSNGIIHGNKSDTGKTVKINITADEDKITVSVKDQGAGFDPSTVPDPTAPENILKDSGRGIHIMNAFVETLKYNFTKDGTETIIVLKRN